MERLQYDALRKATGGVRGARRETIREIAAVEDVDTFAESACGRFLARSMCDPVRAGTPEEDGFEGDPSLGGVCWKGELKECDLGLKGCREA